MQSHQLSFCCVKTSFGTSRKYLERNIEKVLSRKYLTNDYCYHFFDFEPFHQVFFAFQELVDSARADITGRKEALRQRILQAEQDKLDAIALMESGGATNPPGGDKPASASKKGGKKSPKGSAKGSKKGSAKGKKG